MRRRDLGKTPLLEIDKFARVVGDGKLDAMGMGQRISGMQDSKLIRQSIECGDQIVDRIPKDDRTAIQKGTEVGNIRYIHAVLAEIINGIRFDLGSNSWKVGLDCEVLADVFMQGVSVLFCPLYLEPDAL
jgi:hypothetical protein